MVDSSFKLWVDLGKYYCNYGSINEYTCTCDILSKKKGEDFELQLLKLYPINV